MKKNNEKKWYQSPSNLIITILCVLLVPILLINVWIMLQANLNKDKVPSVFGYKPFIVLSPSMENDIFKGDLIITKIVDEPENLKIGDIIAFRDAQNTVTTHRIIDAIEKDGEKFYITKGDNNNTQDQNLVAMDDVEGIYLMRIPAVGNIMNSLAEPTTIIILVLGITMIFGIGFTISNKKQQALEREEFLEYKRMKELEDKSSKTNKMKSIKAEDEVLEDEEKEGKPQSQKKKSSTRKNRTDTSKKTKSKK